MPVFNCPLEGCTYETVNCEASVAASLLMIHNNVHLNENANNSKQKPPKIDRPHIGKESSEEVWNIFESKWKMFKENTKMSGSEVRHQLYQCCDEELGDAILKGHPNIVDTHSENELMLVIKQSAVIPVSKVVRRSIFLGTKQDLGENARAYAARLKGKGTTCSYSVTCPRDGCDQIIDFTDIILKDVLVAGLADEDIRKEVLGWENLDDKDINQTISFIESKEMAADAMPSKKVVSNASISNYKSDKKQQETLNNSKRPEGKISCSKCHVNTDKFIWSPRKNKYVECTVCRSCWRKSRNKLSNNNKSEASALIIGAVTSSGNHNSSKTSSEMKLDHYIFSDQEGWKVSESVEHPTVPLTLSTDKEAYSQIGARCPKYCSQVVKVITDTGAQSCLWGLNECLRAGFKQSNLLPVKRTMVAANREVINIVGALFVQLSGKDADGKVHVAREMVYISPSTSKFYLSRDALIKLCIIDENFPCIGGAAEVSAISSDSDESCGCIPRTLAPGRPKQLPFRCIPENNSKMREWLLNRYKGSTFNKCTHQLLPGMTGPPLKIHLKPDAEPFAVTTAATVPKHWEKMVKDNLDKDERLGCLGQTPIGVPTKWCFRMIIVPKADGTCRRAADYSPLNKYCIRETHHVKPPFIQAREIPSGTWKTVTDAWNGFHSVPLREEDQHLTTFLTPWGRYFYKVAPQGYLASGDAYTRR